MESTSALSVKKPPSSLVLVILALAVLISGGLVSIGVGAGVGMGLLQAFDESTALILAIAGPASVYDWMILLFLLGCLLWFPIVLTIYVIARVTDFKKKGLPLSPFLWGIGMILPSIIIVYPLFWVRARITWPRQLGRLS